MVSEDEGAEFAKKLNMTFIETSAKTGENVEACFMELTKDVYNKMKRGDMEGIRLEPSTDINIAYKKEKQEEKVGHTSEQRPKICKC